MVIARCPVPRKKSVQSEIVDIFRFKCQVTCTMISTILHYILSLFFRIFKPSKKHSDLVLENLALRQQLSIYQNTNKRPKIRNLDRLFWICLSKLWKHWRGALLIVKPDTVIHWHKKGFKLYWKFKSRKRRQGRPPIESKTRQVIEDMAKANPL
jgi:hypothetical protein